MASVIGTPAIVLRSIAYGEADRVVTLLGRETGRVSALARGARKSQRRFGGGLGLGSTGQATLRERAGAELMGLEAFEVLQARLGLGQELARAAHAAYALELCDKLCAPRHPEPAVYDWLDELLTRVESSAASPPRLRVFELGLLERLGLAPSLGSCVGCGRAGAELDGSGEVVRWHPDRGGVVCARCARTGAVLSGSTRRALAQLQRLSLERADDGAVAPEAWAGCRQAMGELIGFHVPGTLKSLTFIEKLSRSR